MESVLVWFTEDDDWVSRSATVRESLYSSPFTYQVSSIFNSEIEWDFRRCLGVGYLLVAGVSQSDMS